MQIDYRMLPGREFYCSFEPGGGLAEARGRLRYLSRWNDWDNETNFVAYDGDKPVGVAGVHFERGEERVISVWFVTVDPEYRNQGIGSKLADMVFAWAGERGLRVRSSTYTELGAAYIKGAFERAAQKYGVPFKDSNDPYLFDYRPPAGAAAP